MKNKFIIVLVIILGIVLSMVGLKYCSEGHSKSDTFIKIIHDTTWNTTDTTSPIYIPGKKIYILGPTITKHVDTAKILADYFAKIQFNIYVRVFQEVQAKIYDHKWNRVFYLNHLSYLKIFIGVMVF
jgi:hypothetical protein